MPESLNQLPYSSSAIESVAATLDEFIDNLQLLRPVSRFAREIERYLMRTIGVTVAPEAVYNRMGLELNRLAHRVDPVASPLFRDILICCRRLIEGLHGQGMFDEVQSIEDSVRDAMELEQQRRVVGYGMLNPLIDILRMERMERTMAIDHRLRGRVAAYIERLEAIIANLPAEDGGVEYPGVNHDGTSDGDENMGEPSSEKAV
ncbi:hypothetical protein DSL72_005759 [Monilinia vaccinii-corymbosi]|uniref:Uncharacterized protein n=1 Tax=Monilinia vaccinii-corymbosi TaxID=61207 RepID=A0A8A3PGM9_9HELO|nr:hypothetical protein DSL72_005759 [Monilinia vaccinii-corymbosi]